MADRLISFPDGTPVDPWFYDDAVPEEGTGREYRVREYGIRDDGWLQTGKMQDVVAPSDLWF